MKICYFALLLSISIAIEANLPRVSEMSLDEKIGQLFVVATVADPDNQVTKDVLFTRSTKNIPSIKLEKELSALIEKYHIGGVLFLGKSSSEKQFEMTERLIALNDRVHKIPLLFALDAEWGPAMRLDDAPKFPFNIALGAIRDKKILREFGFVVGSMLKKLHIGMNFAPVADCNTNYLNPVINRRSFGEKPETVSACVEATIEGLQEAGVIACVKHFPGHGDTAIDTHTGLAIINHSSDRLFNVELIPFKKAINAHVKAIMAGHLLVPELDKKLPATLSQPIMTETVRKKFSFDGLLVTDAMDMDAVTKQYSADESVILALQAGNDLIVAPVDIPRAIARIKQELETGALKIEEIDAHVQRILNAKSWIAAQRDTLANITLADIFNSAKTQELQKELFQKAITLVRNEHILPVAVPTEDLSIIAIGTDTEPPFAQRLCRTNQCAVHLLSKTSPIDEYTRIRQSIFGTIIIAIFGLNYGPAPFGIRTHVQNFINRVCQEHPKTVIVLFGNPYALSLFPKAPALIAAYEDHPSAQEAAANVIIGALKPDGILPVTASPEFPAETSIGY